MANGQRFSQQHRENLPRSRIRNTYSLAKQFLLRGSLNHFSHDNLCLCFVLIARPIKSLAPAHDSELLIDFRALSTSSEHTVRIVLSRSWLYRQMEQCTCTCTYGEAIIR